MIFFLIFIFPPFSFNCLIFAILQQQQQQQPSLIPLNGVGYMDQIFAILSYIICDFVYILVFIFFFPNPL